jgi:hypothetical protein
MVVGEVRLIDDLHLRSDWIDSGNVKHRRFPPWGAGNLYLEGALRDRLQGVLFIAWFYNILFSYFPCRSGAVTGVVNTVTNVV